jgi:hypothetical protein
MEMGFDTTFYAVRFGLLRKIIGSKNNKLEDFFHQKVPRPSELGKEILHHLIQGNYEQLNQLNAEDEMNYYQEFYTIYRLIVNIFGRLLDNDAGSGTIGVGTCLAIDDLLEEKNYPPGFRVQTIFEAREVPGFKKELPEAVEDEYLFFSYISPSTIKKAREIAQHLEDKEKEEEESTASTNKKRKVDSSNLSIRSYAIDAEKKIRKDWLLNKMNIYGISTMHSFKKWEAQVAKSMVLPIWPLNSSENQHCYWNDLPQDLQLHILSFVDDVRTLTRLAQVNKQLHEILLEDEGSDEKYWEPFRRDVGFIAFTC